MNSENFEKYNLFFRGKEPSEILTTPEQTDLLQYGILKKILIHPDENSFELIKTIINQSTDENLIQTCFDDLVVFSQKKNTLAIECLFDLAITYEHIQAVQLIDKHQFTCIQNATNACYFLITHQIKKLFNLPRPLYALQSYFRHTSDEIRTRMISAAEKNAIADWHFTAITLQNRTETPLEEIITTYNSFATDSKLFFLGQLIYRYLHQVPGTLDVLIFLFFHTEDPILHRFINSKLVSNIPDMQYALFLLIDEQWNQVQLVDPGYKFLQQAYRDSDNSLRIKILQKTRTAGIDLAFSDISKQQKIINLGNLSYFDWNAILNSRITEEHLNTMWRLAQIAPPYWSCQILSSLHENRFVPQSNDEASFFEKLLDNLPSLPDKEEQSLLIKEREHSLSSEFQFAAIQTDHGAFYTRNENTIIFCEALNVPKPIFKEVIPPKPLMPAIHFSWDAKYLLWADVDQMINIYEKRTDRIIKRFPAHNSIIRSILLSKDQKHLYTTSFDGSIQAWRFPDGFHEKEVLNQRNEIYAMVLSDSGKYLISGDISGNIQVIVTESLECIHDISANNTPIIGITQPGNQVIATHTSSNQIMVWNFLSKRILSQFESKKNLGTITKLLLTSDENIMFQATNTGNLNLLEPLSGTLYEHYHTLNSPIIEIEEIDHSLWLFQKNGNAMMLNTLLWQLVLSPINHTGNHQLRQLDELLSLPQITKYQQKWLEFIKMLVHWQKRYDISIEEIQNSIIIDDFSITI